MFITEITLNALTAADSVLIPVQAAYLPEKGLEQLITTISRVKKHLNPGITFEGILISMLNRKWTWSHDWKVPYMFIISTNGTMLRENVKKWLLQNKERVRLILSADGDRDSQNHNRSNSYDKIDYRFFKFNWINPEVKMTVSPYSLKNLSNDIIFFHKKGFRFSDCNLAMGIDWSDRHNVATLKNELKKLVTYYIEHPQLTPANIINQEVGRCENKRVMYKWCGVGRELMTVDVDGKKYPCNFITPMTFTEEQLDLLPYQYVPA